MAAEHEGQERTAEELAQLLYHVQVMMVACDLSSKTSTDVSRFSARLRKEPHAPRCRPQQGLACRTRVANAARSGLPAAQPGA